MSRQETDTTVFSDVPSVLEDIRQGRFVIIVDDENRENEGDLALAAEHVTPEKVAFLLNEARGFLCLAIDSSIARQMDLPPMVSENRSRHGTPFTVSVDAKHGISTGVSARDRAQTIQTVIDDEASPDDLVRPGHIMPLAARDGGTLV
ncbi:MAG: 3,4-dihydroxy-2-butanone-4-phosphate synthase, partial [Planctomycetota bacterium]